MAGHWRGRDEVASQVREWLRPFHDYRVEAEQFIDLDEGRVFVLTRDRAIGRASHAPVEMETANVFTLRDGYIVMWEAYWDRDEALKAVGLEE